MQVSLTIENERRLQAFVDAGQFADVETAMNDLLTERLEWHDMVREKIQEADADLKAGRYTDYDEEGLRAYFEELKAEAGISTTRPRS